MNTSGNRYKVDCRIVSPSLLSLVTFDFTGPISCEKAQFPMPVHSPPLLGAITWWKLVLPHDGSGISLLKHLEVQELISS